MLDTKPMLRGWHPLGELAGELRKSKKTIRSWTRQGLRHSKIGGVVLIHEKDLDEFLNGRARGGNLKEARHAGASR